jgi:hypothetical protein
VADGLSLLVRVGLFDTGVTFLQDIALTVVFACHDNGVPSVSPALISSPVIPLPSTYAAVVPAPCSLKSHQTIPAYTAIETNGGVYFSFGPFAATGQLILITDGANNCAAGSDTVLQLSDGGSRVAYSDDGYGRGACSYISYFVDNDVVADGLSLLVRAGLFDTGVALLQDIALIVVFVCHSNGVPSISPAVVLSPAIPFPPPPAAVVAATCSLDAHYTIPAYTTIETYGGVYFAIGPFPATGQLIVFTEAGQQLQRRL